MTPCAHNSDAASSPCVPYCWPMMPLTEIAQLQLTVTDSREALAALHRDATGLTAGGEHPGGLS